MSFDGPRENPTTRPLPQGNPPSPYAQDPNGASPAQPYGATTEPYEAPAQPYGAPTEPYGAPAQATPSWAIGPATQVFDQAQPAGRRPQESDGAGPQGPGGPPAPPARGPRNGRGGRRGGRGWRSPVFLVPAVIGVLLVVAAAATVVVVKLRGVEVADAPPGTPTVAGRAANLPPGRTWLSGAWSGGEISTERIDGFGAWRGQPSDVVTTYPAYDTWDQLKDTDWYVSNLNGFKGRLSYGLPILPRKDAGTLADVAAGKHDDVFRGIAEVLNKHNRQDTFVRIGLEANGTWFPWGVGADKAEDYKAAWRHVQSVMKEVSPKLNFGFDITCGKALEGGSDRLDNLNKLYPGDDVVDIVGCDHYDQYHVKTRNAGEWKKTLRPADAGGLGDVVDFARAHKKQIAFPEWGLAMPSRDGAGDNPFFIYSMYQFFLENKDILAYENYFNEPDDSLGSAIWDSAQNPRGAAEYKKLWGAAPNFTQPAKTP